MSPEYSTARNSLIRPSNLDVLAEYARSAPHGAFVEVGVYRGGSARVLYQIAVEQWRSLWLFDTFTGHPTPSAEDSPKHPEGRYADCADPAALQQEMPNARIIVGKFPTGPMSYPNGMKLWPVAFVHVDVDLYESTRDVILAFQHELAPGGLFLFDDYGVPDCPGATKAVDELLPDRQILSNGKALWRRP
jgi:O-methyltransferase